MSAVIIATTGRPDLTAELLTRLGCQTHRPEFVVLAPARPGDLPPQVDKIGTRIGSTVVVMPHVVGLAHQRNCALEWLLSNTDVLKVSDKAVVFFDDDFVPRHDWIARVLMIFRTNADVCGVTGLVLADGIKSSGLCHEDADQILSAHPNALDDGLVPATLYGCNMAIRGTIAATHRFDEMLPLYAWQEDYDYSQRIALAGKVMRAASLVGVHLGTKGGRVSGRRFGYSQIANPCYLLGKGTMSPRKALRLVGGNLCMNLARTPFPEPYVDRVGRLIGNIQGVCDLVTGRLDPQRIIRM